jgi:hypothetical protein
MINGGESMTDALDALAMWWRAEREWTPVRGFPAECPSCRDYRTSTRYDSGPDGNGADETDARGRMIRHIGGLVQSIEEPYRTALYMTARNRALGVSLWCSPRLPADPTERAHVVAEAVERFGMLL